MNLLTFSFHRAVWFWFKNKVRNRIRIEEINIFPMGSLQGAVMQKGGDNTKKRTQSLF